MILYNLKLLLSFLDIFLIISVICYVILSLLWRRRSDEKRVANMGHVSYCTHSTCSILRAYKLRWKSNNYTNKKRRKYYLSILYSCEKKINSTINYTNGNIFELKKHLWMEEIFATEYTSSQITNDLLCIVLRQWWFSTQFLSLRIYLHRPSIQRTSRTLIRMPASLAISSR